MTSKIPAEILLYNRKPRSVGNYSIEGIFSLVAQGLGDRFNICERTAPVLSNGVVNRLRIIADAKRHAGTITHFTGDIHFANSLFKPETAILTIHDVAGLWQAQPIKKWLWLDLPLRHARWLTTVSEFSKQEIIRASQRNDLDIRVIPPIINPIFSNTDDYSPSPKPTSLPSFLFIGSTPNKNLIACIGALTGLSAHLNIVGQISPEEKSQLNSAGISWQQQQNISAEVLFQLYRQSSALLFPSTYEGFGMPILEAQAAGCPVITSNIAPLTGVAGDAALFVDPRKITDLRQAIENLLNYPKKATELIRAGRVNVSRFNSDEILNKYASLYAEALARACQ